MLHSDVIKDGITNCNGELANLGEEKDIGGQPLLFLRCSLCGMEFAFSLDSGKALMIMPGPIH
jgi:hypothetical protein